MPHLLGMTAPPSIIALNHGRPVAESSSRISIDTYVKLDSETPNCLLFFTTDGISPDPINRFIGGVEKTMKYKGPFKLRVGTRIITAVAYNRTDRRVSQETKRIFQVDDTPLGHRTQEYFSDSDSIVYSDDMGRSTFRRGQVSRQVQLAEHLRRESVEYDRHRRPVETDSETSASEVYTDMSYRTGHGRPPPHGYSHRTSYSDAESYSPSRAPPHITSHRGLGYISADSDSRAENYPGSRPRSRAASRSSSRSPGQLRRSIHGAPPRVHFNDTFDIAPPREPQWNFTDSSYLIPAPLPLRAYPAWSGPLITEPYLTERRHSSRDRNRRESPRSVEWSFARETSADSHKGKDKKKKSDKDSSASSSNATSSSSSSSSSSSVSSIDTLTSSLRHFGPSKTKPEDGMKVGEKSKKGKDDKPKKKHGERKGKEGSHIGKSGKEEKSDKEVKVRDEEKAAKTKDEGDKEKASKKEKSDLKLNAKFDIQSTADVSRDKISVAIDKPEKSKDEKGQHRGKENKESSNLDQKRKTESRKPEKTAEIFGEKKTPRETDLKVKDQDKDQESGQMKNLMLGFKYKHHDGKGGKKNKGEKISDVIVPKRRVPWNSETAGLSSTNDWGTQSNVWGLSSDDALKKAGSATAPGKPQLSDRNSPSSSISLSQTAPSSKSVVRSKKETTQEAALMSFGPSTPSESTLSKSKPPKSLGGRHSKIFKMMQTEQKSMSGGGFSMKKFFKGWSPSAKTSIKFDPRWTIRELDHAHDADSSYSDIVSKCLQSKTLWEDPDFPAEESSLFYSKPTVQGKIEWMRPKEISPDAEMFVGGASRFDVQQGCLGNCWLLAAVASLSTDKKLLKHVVPPRQSFQDDYAGVFHFHFWQYGKWVDVCIDDRLPTVNKRLVFMHSGQPNEFWSALLEKAYAKICGSYESLCGGLASEAMTDFTGGVVERFNFSEELPDNMFQILIKAKERRSLMSCAIDQVSSAQSEEELENGLVVGHAYSITDVKLVPMRESSVELVRVRNPWGNDCEWKGAWSDDSSEWQTISEEQKTIIGLTFAHDGEFWMDFKDFITFFNRVELCNLSPDDLIDKNDSVLIWNTNVIEGGWKKNVNAGGCRNFPKTAWCNPQYNLKVTDVDDNDDERLGTVIVSLMQKGTRQLRQQGQGNLTIGYEIFSMPGDGQTLLDRESFLRHPPVASVPAYIDMREVCGRHRLPVGDYIVMPTTFDPNEEADFMLRLFTEKAHGISEADKETCLLRLMDSDGKLVEEPVEKLPCEAEEKFNEFAGEDAVIDPYEVCEILNQIFNKDAIGQFDLNLCRSLVALRDVDHTGKLSLEEFQRLWSDLATWKAALKKYDEDNNGYFNSFELREALNAAGFQVSNATFSILVTRYSNKDGHVYFSDFVAAIARLTSMFEVYQSKCQQPNEKAEFGLDEFVQMTLYS